MYFRHHAFSPSANRVMWIVVISHFLKALRASTVDMNPNAELTANGRESFSLSPKQSSVSTISVITVFRRSNCLASVRSIRLRSAAVLDGSVFNGLIPACFGLVFIPRSPTATVSSFPEKPFDSCRKS